MLGRSVSLLFCTLVTAAAYNGPGSHPEVTIYRLKQNITGELLRDDQAARVAANLEELIMSRDSEQQFSLKNMEHNLERKYDATAYCEIPHKDLCSVNNGNCSQICETVETQRVCSCIKGYTLTSDTECRAVSSCDIVLSGTAGEFTIDTGYCQWLIKAPNLHTINLTLHSSTAYDYDGDYVSPDTVFGQLYDGNSTAASLITHISPREKETVLTSSGQYLLIKTDVDHDYSYTQRVSYVISDPQYLEIKAGKRNGHITVSSVSEGEGCFSLTHSTPKDGSLMVNLQKSYNGGTYFQALYPKFSFKDNDGKLKKDIFLIPMTDSDRELIAQGTTKLNFEFRGEGTKVFNLRKCLNLEYYAVGRKLFLGADAACRNGGSWSSADHACRCPPGFVGVRCEEGCGPNRYGENCSRLCSNLRSACEGMLFCTEDSCSCAPGLQGINCDSPCNSGNYGASCQQHCGKCKDDEPCDRYTGVCSSGCAGGFYPPLCQQTYKVLTTAPHIIGVTYNSMKIRISFEKLTGEGEPIFFEVQYKEEEETVWSKFSPRKIPSKTNFDVMTEFYISGLLPGRVYETRVVLIDKDGGSYQTDVPKTKATTKCLDLQKGDYTFSAKDVDETGILLEWSYEHDKTSMMCEIVAFELSVVCGSEHLQFLTTEKKGSKRLSDILPEKSCSFQLVGKTVTGQRTPPVDIEVRTPAAAPGRVRSVEAWPLASGRQLNVTWRPPWGAQPQQLRYAVSYQCVRLLACDNVNCSSSSGYTKVSATSALLAHLLPHALYHLEVAAVSPSGLLSASYVVNAVTADTAPHVTPSAPENPILAVTNTSASITWLPPEDCSGLNGYIYGYSYSLVENDTEEVIRQGTVPENILSVNFSGLLPTHCYDAHITVVSSGGTSLVDELQIPFCTTSTAPDRVQSLSVYKRGRRMVGLRWLPPLNTYGEVESFSVSYTREGSGHSRRLVTPPRRCGAWPDRFCYTVTGLSPGRKYRFEVQARNKEVSVDGEAAAVEAITSEGVSTPPVNLRIVNSTENSMLVEWGMPDNINGQLRSFMIMVAQIDTQADSDECCEEIPFLDYRVTSEQPSYLYEITDLSAASTYSVTVSAKTVTLGEDSRVTGHTFPPKASLPQNALVVVNSDHTSHQPADGDGDGEGVVTLEVQPAPRISGVNRKYFLLYLTNDSTTHQPLHDELADSLKSIITENYHLLSEYTQEEIENQSVVTFHLKELGFVSKEIESQRYALVLIQDYMGNRSVDVFITEETGDEMED